MGVKNVKNSKNVKNRCRDEAFLTVLTVISGPVKSGVLTSLPNPYSPGPKSSNFTTFRCFTKTVVSNTEKCGFAENAAEMSRKVWFCRKVQ